MIENPETVENTIKILCLAIMVIIVLGFLIDSLDPEE